MVRRLHWPKLFAAIAAALLAFSTDTFAGPRGGSSSGFRDRTHQSGDRWTSRDNSQGSRDFSGRESSQNSSDEQNAGSNDSERSDAQSGASSGSDRGGVADFFRARNGEQVVEKRTEKADEKGETADARPEKSEVAKKFDSTLLFADVAPNRGENRSGPTQNPGVNQMSQQGLENSAAGRATAQQRIDQHGASNVPPGNHFGWRRGEDNPYNGLHRLSDREKARIREFLNESLTDAQKARLHEILRDGLTDTEREQLRHFFERNLTDREQKALGEILRHILRNRAERERPDANG